MPHAYLHNFIIFFQKTLQNIYRHLKMKEQQTDFYKYL